MATPEDLRAFFSEHASQAKKHEEQREKVTNLVLTIAGVLTGLVTFSKLSLWALPAAIALVLLGGFGLLFSGKHYERSRMHTEILREVRIEIDKGSKSTRTLSELTAEGRRSHYASFKWPNFRADDKNQQGAKSWVARQRLNVFWEGIHVLVVLIGVGLAVAILITASWAREEEVQKVIVIGAEKSAIEAIVRATSQQATPPVPAASR